MALFVNAACIEGTMLFKLMTVEVGLLAYATKNTVMLHRWRNHKVKGVESGTSLSHCNLTFTFSIFQKHTSILFEYAQRNINIVLRGAVELRMVGKNTSAC